MVVFYCFDKVPRLAVQNQLKAGFRKGSGFLPPRTLTRANAELSEVLFREQSGSVQFVYFAVLKFMLRNRVCEINSFILSQLLFNHIDNAYLSCTRVRGFGRARACEA
jgi:hypothetical protein